MLIKIYENFDKDTIFRYEEKDTKFILGASLDNTNISSLSNSFIDISIDNKNTNKNIYTKYFRDDGFDVEF